MISPVAGLRRTIALTIRSKVAGEDADAKAASIWGGDAPRRYGPDDPIWRVNQASSMYVGGIRALLLQSLHPLAMAGVAGHSGYKSDPWGRLQRTSTFIATTTFGPAGAADAAVAQVRAIHERVRGKADDGTPYRAGDPHLLAWVHCAETDSFLDAYQRFMPLPLTPAEADTYVAQSAWTGEALGAEPLPRTVADLRAALDAFRPELRASQAALETARFIVREPPLPWFGKPAYGLLVAGAIASLPGWARRELRLPDVPLADRAIALPLGQLGVSTIDWAMSDPSLAGSRRSAR